MKKALIFPGQGSQFPGMARELYDGNPEARRMMDEANAILGFKITETMFDGTDEDLRATKVTQPAIYIHSTVLAACSGLTANVTGGHSLGEFSALVAAGSVSFADGLKLVSIRARAMQRCCEAHPGTMAAVIGMADEDVAKVCSGIDGLVIPANYNCPGQVVISGEEESIDAACKALKAAGAKRALPLSVSGAFHSPLMEPARAELAAAIASTEIKAPRCPVYQNVTGAAETDPDRIRQNLLSQLTSPVLWSQSVHAMLQDGVDEFVELGPGTVLQGLVRRICNAEGKEVSINGMQ